LLAAGYPTVCLARDPGRLSGRGWEGVEIRRGDALDAASLGPALDGIATAFYLIHSMAEGTKGFESRDRIAAENFAAAARDAGVSRIVYLGGLGETDDQTSAHLASRHEVGDVLRAAGVPVTEFRAAVIVGAGSVSFEMIRYLTERLPVMITPRWVTTRCQPIAIENVLDYLVGSVSEPVSAGRTLEIGGPDVLTYGDMMRGYAAERGLKRLLIPVPFLTPRLSSYWVDLVTPIPSSFSHPLIEGLRSEVIVHDPAAQELFHVDLIPYREAVRQALERIGTGDVETNWTGARSRLAEGVTLRDTEGMIIEERRLDVSASAARVYSVFSSVGGKRGWFYAGWAWRLRGLLDRLAGGVGMRRGRRSPNQLRPGDAVDFWRVEAVEPGRLLRLRAEMKVPGRAWLQFEAVPADGERSQLIQTAFFEPHGLPGLAYWYVLYPLHQLIFSGMARSIASSVQKET
ncbi:MAG: SDR family oxidoreductase, partial [Thermoanaerobaculia bacterium]